MHDRTHDHLDRAASATMVALCALWGLGQVTIKVANAGISPGVQAGLRSVGAGLLVLLWARLRGVRLFARDGTWRAGIAAGLLFALEFMLIYWSLTFTQAVRATLFIYLAPFVV